MADILGQLLDFLQANQTDPLTYLILFFLFSFAAAVILPIPIEIGLAWNPGMFFPLKALDLGLGKAVGAVAVFFIPSSIGSAARRLEKWRPIDRLRRTVDLAAQKSGISNLRLYRAIGQLYAALCVGLRKCGIDRSRMYRRVRKGNAAGSTAPAPPTWGWLQWLSRKSETFVRRYGVIAMYVLMSIPGMIDTVTLYIFSIINRDHTLMRLRDFALANFLAGINRAFIIFALLEILGIELF